MEKVIAGAKHKVEGAWRLEVVGEHVRFTCHWPFDSQTDEWIEVANTFSFSDFKAAVTRLSKDKEVRVHGLRSGFINLKVMAEDGNIQMSVAGADQIAREEIVMTLRLHPNELLPLLTEGEVKR